ncbi:MAG: hypothetical protein JNK58_04640 [Phycisphaerae bacterium]|nr:hypothetical protein [Phycisphaerae bacterium]
MRLMLAMLGLCALGLWSSAVAQPAGEPGMTGSVRVVGTPTNVDELLSALESADQGIRTFQTGVMYDRRFVLQGDRHVRLGELYYEVAPAAEGSASGKPRRMFSIDFKTLTIDGTRREDRNTWVFDGQWLVEKRPGVKQYVARQVARPEDPMDPLGLGESPIPFPIGQKKSAILERYEATMLKPFDGLTPGKDADEEEKRELSQRREDVKETYQLRLAPRGAFADEDQFKEIRLWYTKDEFLPRMARTINRAGDESTVLLINPKVNASLPEGAIDIEPPPSAEGWDVQIDTGRFKDVAR